MRVKLFTFRYSATLGGFDDTSLSNFVRDKEVISFREHFFTVNEVPHLACVLIWQDALVASEDLETARSIQPRERDPGKRATSRSDPTAGLSEPERVLFNSLREWRSSKAHEEGVPPYLIFTNRHFLEIVKQRPASPSDLGHISGIGPGKLKRYGEELLELMPPRDRRC